MKALIKFLFYLWFSENCADQGTNLKNNLNRSSSAYHPETQGALQHWHHTFKSVLRKYCLDTGRCWDEGLPFTLFALSEKVWESLGFSPAEFLGILCLVPEKF